MSEKDVLDWFQTAAYLSIARAIQSSPKTAKEITEIIGHPDAKTGEMLGYLERSGAIEYTGTGWKLTTLGQQVLKKYFE